MINVNNNIKIAVKIVNYCPDEGREFGMLPVRLAFIYAPANAPGIGWAAVVSF